MAVSAGQRFVSFNHVSLLTSLLGNYCFSFLYGLACIEQALLSRSVSCPQRAELSVLLDDVGQIERSVFLGRLYVGVSHYLLEGAQVTALDEKVLAEGMSQTVRAQL